MSTGPTVLLLSTQSAFFEQRETCFNRRGVDVFCALSVREAAQILSRRRVDLLLTRGIPEALSPDQLRQSVPDRVKVVVLAVSEDDEMALAAYAASEDIVVVRRPYGDELMDLTAKALDISVRSYLRILVQLQLEDAKGGGAFGFSNDLSASGILVETRRELPLGSKVGLSFLLPGAPSMTSVAARVVREAGAQRPGTHRYGMQFEELSSDDRARILSLTERRSAEAYAAGLAGLTPGISQPARPLQ